jgi:hypothetical protein
VSLVALVLILVLICALWGAAPTFYTRAPAAPSWVGLVVVVLVVFVLLDALGVIAFR